MGKLPYIPFYTGDWLKDPALSMCSPASRGIWVDLLCAMHEQGRKGIISGTAEQLARVARCSPNELIIAAEELKACDAANVTRYVLQQKSNSVVTIINRRMKREDDARKSVAERQKRYRKRHNSEEEGQESQNNNAKVTNPLSSSITSSSSSSITSSSSSSINKSSCHGSEEPDEQKAKKTKSKKTKLPKTTAQQIPDAWNKAMDAKVSLTAGYLETIQNNHARDLGWIEKYIQAAPSFPLIDDSDWPNGKVSWAWSLRMFTASREYSPVVDRVLDGVYRLRGQPFEIDEERLPKHRQTFKPDKPIERGNETRKLADILPKKE